MRKIRAGILGASGYTGSDLLRFLLPHPSVEIAYLTADRHAGKRISDVFPHLAGFCDLELSPLDPKALPEDIDIVFLGLPHGASAKVVGELYDREIKIIDLGADFRLSHEVYTVWYGEHPHPGLIPEAVYGIPEINRERLKTVKLVANPGCYPTSVILGLLPLAWEQLLQPGLVIADSKSGVSGAGRNPSLDTHFCEVNEGVKAYKVGEHRHMPEIEEIMREYSGIDLRVQFVPHLIPMDRGILSTIYVRLNKAMTTRELLELYGKHYENERFVRICPEKAYPSTSQVKGSNFCDIGIKGDPESKSAIIVSVIDNLVKGASGVAVQNMNIMMGFEESEGLNIPPMFP